MKTLTVDLANVDSTEVPDLGYTRLKAKANGTMGYRKPDGTEETFAGVSELHAHANKSLLDTYTQTEADLADAVTHSESAHAPADAQKNSDITKAEIEAKLTGEISSHTHPEPPSDVAWIAYHVSVDGDDSNNGAAITPWATLQHALDHIANYTLPEGGTFINLGVGTFNEAGPITISHPDSERLSIVGQGLSNTTISVTTTGTMMNIKAGRHLRSLADLTLMGSAHTTGYGIGMEPNSYLNISSVVVSGRDTGLSMASARINAGTLSFEDVKYGMTLSDSHFYGSVSFNSTTQTGNTAISAVNGSKCMLSALSITDFATGTSAIDGSIVSVQSAALVNVTTEYTPALSRDGVLNYGDGYSLILWDSDAGIVVKGTAESNYYVSTSGSDTNDGSQASPWASLAHAMDYLRTLRLHEDGTTINMVAGVHTATDLSLGHTDGHKLSIVGATGTTIQPAGAGLCIFKVPANHTVASIDNIDITDPSGYVSYALRLETGSSITLNDTEIYTIAAGIWGSNARLMASTLSITLATAFGISVANNSDVNISNLILNAGTEPNMVGITAYNSKVLLTDSVSVQNMLTGLQASNGTIMDIPSAINLSGNDTDTVPAISSGSYNYGTGQAVIKYFDAAGW